MSWSSFFGVRLAGGDAGPLSSTAGFLLDALPLLVSDRHYRKARNPNESEILECRVGLDFGKRHGARQLLHRADVDDCGFSGVVSRICVSVGQSNSDPYDGLLIPRVVVKDSVPLLHGMKMLLGDWISNAAPNCALVFDERIKSVVGRFFLNKPIHRHIIAQRMENKKPWHSSMKWRMLYVMTKRLF